MSFEIINGKAYTSGIENYSKVTNNKENSNNNAFKDILNKTIAQNNSYKISKHANERLNSINFTNEDIFAIEKGLELARVKGGRNSVLLYKDVAIIANIPNKTIITAIEKERAKENVYTNIDSVVIL